jgi:pimeloyl-ACP methyl ester carboxylesterase
MTTGLLSAIRNSTNVRSMTVADRGRRSALGLVAAVAPALAARWAIRLFCTPPRHAPTAREREALTTARPVAVRVGNRRVQAWVWGDGPAVLLVHGWGGRGAQLAAFGPPLVAAGRAVVAFDAPGHGASAGRRASLLDLRDAVRAVAASVGPVHGLVAHSLGAAAATLALGDGLAVGRAVFLAPPADPVAYFRRFLGSLGLPPATHPAIETAFERRYPFRWRDLSVPALARRLATPLLVVHDRLDREVAWEDGAAIAAAWPGAELVSPSGLGHRKILREPGVIARVVAFLAEPATPAGDRFAPTDALERELFDRESRWARGGAPAVAPGAAV